MLLLFPDAQQTTRKQVHFCYYLSSVTSVLTDNYQHFFWLYMINKEYEKREREKKIQDERLVALSAAIFNRDRMIIKRVSYVLII